MINLTTKDKKYLQYGAIGLGVILLFRYFNKDYNQGVVTDPTGGSIAPYIFNASNVANALWVAMKNMGVWSFCDKSCEDDVFAALKFVNAQQFSQVVKAFGKRKYNNVTGNNYEVWGFPISSYDLKHWLKQELSSEKYNTLRLKYPGQL